MFVGADCRVDAVDLYTRGRLASHYPDHVRGVLEDFRVFRRIHDTCLIQSAQTVLYNPHVFKGKSFDTLLVFFMKTLNLLFFRLDIIVVVRLKTVHNTVFLHLYGLVGLVDGEVELRNHRTVHPRLSYIIAELRSTGSRKEPHDDCRRDDHHGNPRDQSLILLIIVNVVSGHIFIIICFILRKYKKK